MSAHTGTHLEERALVVGRTRADHAAALQLGPLDGHLPRRPGRRRNQHRLPLAQRERVGEGAGGRLPDHHRPEILGVDGLSCKYSINQSSNQVFEQWCTGSGMTSCAGISRYSLKAPIVQTPTAWPAAYGLPLDAFTTTPIACDLRYI